MYKNNIYCAKNANILDINYTYFSILVFIYDNNNNNLF